MAVSRTDGFSDLVRAWLAECLPRAMAYARSLVRDGNEADDLVQECVYRLLKRAGGYDLPRDGSRLLFRAITNECINRARRGRDVVGLEMRDDEDRRLEGTLADPRAEQPLEIVLTVELRRVLDHPATGEHPPQGESAMTSPLPYGSAAGRLRPSPQACCSCLRRACARSNRLRNCSNNCSIPGKPGRVFAPPRLSRSMEKIPSQRSAGCLLRGTHWCVRTPVWRWYGWDPGPRRRCPI
jgi:RNA polymerase sigma factor (sigma-70 family)